VNEPDGNAGLFGLSGLTLGLIIGLPILITTGFMIIGRWDSRATVLAMMWAGWTASALLMSRRIALARLAFWVVAVALIGVMFAVYPSMGLGLCAVNVAVYLGLGSRVFRNASLGGSGKETGLGPGAQ